MDFNTPESHNIMNKNILVLLLIIIATGMWTYSSNKKIAKNSLNPEKVSNFEFQSIKNTEHSLSDFEGQPILLHFWATWCAPCIEELPKLINLAESEPEKVTIIAIAVNDKSKDIQRFLSKTTSNIPNNFIIGLDPDKSISKDIYGTIQLPETYILTSDLILLEKIIGSKDNWDDYYGKNNLSFN